MRSVALIGLCLIVVCGSFAQAQQSRANSPANKIPALSAELGDCWVEMRVTDSASKPIYGASVAVRMRYGFGGFHKLDMEVVTNVEGRARFNGLTDRARMPLEFTVRYQQRETIVSVDLRKNCHTSESAVLPDKPSPPEANPSS